MIVFLSMDYDSEIGEARLHFAGPGGPGSRSTITLDRHEVSRLFTRMKEALKEDADTERPRLTGATISFGREELLDLLTTAAIIGREASRYTTRGEITEFLLTFPGVRDYLPKEGT